MQCLVDPYAGIRHSYNILEVLEVFLGCIFQICKDALEGLYRALNPFWRRLIDVEAEFLWTDDERKELHVSSGHILFEIPDIDIFSELEKSGQEISYFRRDASAALKELEIVRRTETVAQEIRDMFFLVIEPLSYAPPGRKSFGTLKFCEF